MLEWAIKVICQPFSDLYYTQTNLTGNSVDWQTRVLNKVLLSFPDTISQDAPPTHVSILAGKKLAETAKRLTEQAIIYKHIHYESIEKTLASRTLDCSSFVRRAIYETAGIDIGNIMSDRFAISDKFEAFTRRSQALPGDIVHIRGHVAICQDNGCRTVAEAANTKVGLVTRPASKSAIAMNKWRVIYYRLK